MRKTLIVICSIFLLGAVWLCVAAPRGELLANIPFGVLTLDSRGDILRLGLASDDKYRLKIGLDQISPEAVEAALEYEDHYFFQHPGINPISFVRAAISCITGRRMGASTLTMQVVRLIYDLRTNSISGKLKQIWLALAIEIGHSKHEILEAYFNLAPYGGNIEGIEAASRIYFHKSASRLTALESRALAIVPQNPNARNPANGKAFDVARARLEANLTKTPLKIYAPAESPFLAPHLALELENSVRIGNIQTSIERDLQIMLERSLKSYIASVRHYGIHNASALLLRWTDMQVCGLVGSADFNSGAISGQIDGTNARRSPGSTLKPFIYALALEQGLIHPKSILPDSPCSYGGYDPENFDRNFRGPIPAHEALKTSRNLPAIHLAVQLRQPGLYGMLRNAEVKFQFGPEHYGLALALGGAEVTMRELASLYAMLPNQGLWQPLRFMKKDAVTAWRRIISPEAAWLTLDMLARPEAFVQSGGNLIPYYYKTGTSNGFHDAWTAGIIGDYVLIVWLGNFDNRANPNLVGATAALPLFEELARSLAILRQLTPPQKSPDLKLAAAEVCPATGDIFTGQCAYTEPVLLITGVSPTRETGVLRRILIDEASGLRSCAEAGRPAREVWHEFWPSDLRDIFAKAGIHKADPPEWLPQCRRDHAKAAPPRIALPKKNVVYQLRLGDNAFKLPLQAAADADAGRIYWYAGSVYIGSANPGETTYWRPDPGKYTITAIDEAGRSARQECEIVALP